MTGIVASVRAGLSRFRTAIGRGDEPPLAEAVYRHLIDTLFTMRMPIVGMGLLVTGIGSLVAFDWGDWIVGAIALLSGLVTVGRAALISAYRRADPPSMTVAELCKWERLYAIGSYVTAILVAAFAVRTFEYHAPLVHMLAVSLVFTLGAGIVSRIATRPVICVTSLLLATVPTTLGLALHATRYGTHDLHVEAFMIEAVMMALVTALSLNTVVHLYRTIVERVTSEHEFASLARLDPLTGLPNRLMLRERFLEGVRSAAHAQQHLALHYLDLDGFKAINDLHGHPAGDALLRQVSERLSRTVRASDTVARLGGDEFVIVQCRVHHESEAEVLARRIIRSVSAPYAVDGQMMSISVSVGIAMAPENGIEFEKLSACADSALYLSKLRGKAQLQFYRPEEAAQVAA